MKFDGKHIGGMETGPIRFGFRGDEKLGQEYVPIARQFVGDLKRRMQLSLIEDNPVYQQEDFTTLPDGTVIYANSIFGGEGSADIDDVIIDTRKTVKKPQKKYECYGYIVHYTGPNLDVAPGYTVRMPSDKQFGYLDINGSVSWDVEFEGYPDYNAKAAPVVNHPDYEVILLNDAIDELEYVFMGPSTVSRNPNITVADGVYSTEGGFTLTTEYTYIYFECTQDPFGNPIFAHVEIVPEIGYFDLNPGIPANCQPIHTQIKDYLAILYPTQVYTGGWFSAGYPDGCHRFYPTSVTSASWEPKYTWDNYVDTYIAHINHTNQLTYENYLACGNYEGSSYQYYVEIFGNVANAIKRKDDYGIYSDSGFRFKDGKFEFSYPSEETGNGVLLMLPIKGENLSFTYSDEVISENNFIEEQDREKVLLIPSISEILPSRTEPVNGVGHIIINPGLGGEFYAQTHTGETFDKIHIIDPTKYTYDGASMIIADYRYDENGITLPESEWKSNVYADSSQENNMVEGPFGIDCKVEQGWHTIRAQSAFKDGDKMTVYLFTNAGTLVRKVSVNDDIPSDKEFMRIKVGEFQDIVGLSDLLTGA